MMRDSRRLFRAADRLPDDDAGLHRDELGGADRSAEAGFRLADIGNRLGPWLSKARSREGAPGTRW